MKAELPSNPANEYRDQKTGSTLSASPPFRRGLHALPRLTGVPADVPADLPAVQNAVDPQDRFYSEDPDTRDPDSVH